MSVIPLEVGFAPAFPATNIAEARFRPRQKRSPAFDATGLIPTATNKLLERLTSLFAILASVSRRAAFTAGKYLVAVATSELSVRRERPRSAIWAKFGSGIAVYSKRLPTGNAQFRCSLDQRNPALAPLLFHARSSRRTRRFCFTGCAVDPRVGSVFDDCAASAETGDQLNRCLRHAPLRRTCFDRHLRSSSDRECSEARQDCGPGGPRYSPLPARGSRSRRLYFGMDQVTKPKSP